MIYFDNSATTKILPEVFEAMIPYLTEEYGNPSSKYYKLAVNAKDAVESAREQVAKLIGATPEEVIFTSGATESTNMIIKGVSDYKKYYENKGNHILTTTVEHEATLNTCKFLNGDVYSNDDAVFTFGQSNPKVDRGFEVDFLGVNEYGQLCAETLENAIRPTTSIVSVIWANNEIGSINDIKALAEICHRKGTVIHTDATQIVGKLSIDVKDAGVDFVSMSAHKLHGPKGIGAAYIKGDDYGLPPYSAFMHGGKQENGMRGSTLSVHNIVGFGKAAEIAIRDKEIRHKKISDLDTMCLSLLKGIEYIGLLGDPQKRLPGVFSIIVNKEDFNNERFIKKISDEYAVSTGSACTAGQPSHVLQAIGKGDLTSKVLRVSISENTNPEDVEKLISTLSKI